MIISFMQGKWAENWIICIQEPYKTGRGVNQLPRQAEAFWVDDEEGSARAMILMPKHMGGYVITQHSSRDCIIVRVLQGRLSVASVYCDGMKDVDHGWKAVAEECRVTERLIICADANATHAVWGGGRGHARGRDRGHKTMAVLDSLGLHVCNNPDSRPTYLGPRGRTSHIDITACTAAIIYRIIGWEVMTKDFHSDHRAIHFKYQLEGGSDAVDNQNITIPWKKPTKGGLAMMEKNLPQMVTHRKHIRGSEDIELFWKLHSEEIRRALGKLFPSRKRSKGRKVYWWTDEVRTAYKNYKAARKKLSRANRRQSSSIQSDREQLVEEIKIRRGRWRFEVKKAKMESWKNFTSGITDPWSGIHKVLRATNVGKGRFATLSKGDGEFGADLLATLKLLGEQFFPALPLEMDEHRSIEDSVEIQLAEWEEGPDITRLELWNAMREMAASSAPGGDGITSNVIRILLQGGWEKQYLDFFNTSLRESKIPLDWKRAKMVLIPKSGAPLTTTKSVRPISLTAIHCKLLERILNRRMAHELEVNGGLAATQHAYRKGGSTTTALYEVGREVEKALARGWVCQALFLDISGAFDRAWHGGILSEMLKLGVSKYLVRWVRSYLRERTACFEAGKEKHEKTLNQGCPQGGVLSPLLWNVVFNELLLLKEDRVPAGAPPIRLIGYADDAIVLCQAKSGGSTAVRMQRFIKKIQDWAVRYRVVFNPAKMHTMIFSKNASSRRPTPANQLSFEGTPINTVQQCKYLGILLQSGWTWKSHIESCLEKLRKVIRMFRGCVREAWGVRTQIMRIFYNSMFKPIMLYGITVWADGAKTKEVQKKFDKVIREYALMSTRTFRTTSQEVLLQIMDLRPFVDEMEEELMRISILQLHMMGDGKRRGTVVRDATKMHRAMRASWGHLADSVYGIKNINLLHHHSEHPANWFRVACTYEDRIASVWAATNVSGWVLYTDASASSYGLGWAVTGYRHGFLIGVKYGSLKSVSVFSAELYAIEQAARATREWCKASTEEIEIRTDSLACVRTLEAVVVVDPNVRRCKDQIKRCKQEGYGIRLRWMPGHHDIEGNEYADAVAKRGVDSAITAGMHFVARDARREMRKKMMIVEKARFANITSTPFRWFFPTKSKIRQYTAGPRSAALNQLVSGHCRINHYLAKVGAASSQGCDCGDGDETVEHYLCRCPLFTPERNRVWGVDFLDFTDMASSSWETIERFLHATRRLTGIQRELSGYHQ